MKETNQVPPLLLVLHGKDNDEKQTFYSLSEKRFYSSRIPQLENKCILASAYGWLVLVDYDTEDCCLWNPLSSEVIDLDLPDWECSPTYGKCVLSKPPTDPDCHILFLCDCENHLAFCGLGDDYHHVLVGKSLMSDDLSINAATSLDGKIYLYGTLISTPCFVIADFIDKTGLELRPLFMANILFTSILPIWNGGNRRFYLIKSACGRELLLVVELMWWSGLCDDGLFFKIYRVDMTQNKFVELENIGNQTIFLNHQEGKAGDGVCVSSSSSSSSTKGVLKPNSIYYIVADSKNLYICDLDDMSQTVFLPFPAARRSQSITYWVDQLIQKASV